MTASADSSREAAGRLTVVGTGIQGGTDFSEIARSHVSRADDVLFLSGDGLSQAIVKTLGANAESLTTLYASDKPRQQTYDTIVERTLELVRRGRTVCLVLPGHPGVYSQSGHRAVAGARAEGYNATMLPAISAEDRLIADLGIDPGEHGCFSVDATDFLFLRKQADPTASLILWQIGFIGDSCAPQAVNRRGLALLSETLCAQRGPRHQAIVYDAARYPISKPAIFPVALEDLADAQVTLRSTLYVPPSAESTPDQGLIARFLGMD